MSKKTKQSKRVKPSLRALQSELRELMLTDPDAVEKRLDELALTDPESALNIGENIGFYEPDVYLGNGVYCTANAIMPDESAEYNYAAIPPWVHAVAAAMISGDWSAVADFCEPLEPPASAAAPGRLDATPGHAGG